MKHLKYFIYLLLFQLLFTGLLYADINSWVDENGVRHYSDSPPERPEGTYDVLEEIENKAPPKDHQQERDNLDEIIEQRKAEEEARRQEQLLEKQKADQDEKVKNAFAALSKLRNFVAGEVDWDEYERLLADARKKLAELADIAEVKTAREQLTETYESFAIVPELKRLEMTGQRKGLIAQIKKMNEKLGTEAPENYYKARAVFWQYAADKLDNFGKNP